MKVKIEVKFVKFYYLIRSKKVDTLVFQVKIVQFWGKHNCPSNNTNIMVITSYNSVKLDPRTSGPRTWIIPLTKRQLLHSDRKEYVNDRVWWRWLTVRQLRWLAVLALGVDWPLPPAVASWLRSWLIKRGQDDPGPACLMTALNQPHDGLSPTARGRHIACSVLYPECC